ncbi:MAG: hypothetical protein A2445_01335 [Candidatus Jacksonbacteria bacterium RIFOXYC2_FULL_44_29]|nr:MAG: hypothetical protein UW45_C0013G0031 [Parcubacteria group bacterium GW2011_GWC2_44_22]OGY76533.1 MAG: hypothetical protein A2295_02150 [Candidatus Jacksonbacteria bacterium RIFOXYB2_FULL_44_15]OGY76547.1 MAG: hypothetical protein A2240_03775 [Candidatus Jacksonbacteria bacterium RIFOXYA2_FULL_43_12]OGY78513.1 MAG: hypothetical protein A2445_01335 [Candidatus Jacksonbacteria bacterium RIFOXYC2_FULL_44_29]OGY81170.1 MAG: hypothetical protein A2550_01730 [Candidatus Jacksonbacteria bacteri
MAIKTQIKKSISKTPVKISQSRHHLFGLRVILTEILVAAIGVVLLILPFLVQGWKLVALTSMVFALYCFFGYLLIKSILHDAERKGILEQEVTDRTHELEQAKNLAESRSAQLEKAKNSAIKTSRELKKRNAELERFYNLTVGRELKMIELKKQLQKFTETAPNQQSPIV